MVITMLENRLLEIREYHNLYQKDIAKIIKVSQQAYSFWENNTKIIPLSHLNELCNYFNISMDYALNLSKSKTSTKINKIDNLNRVEIGKRLAWLRHEKNITNRALAKELNTTSSTISAYETGKTLILTIFAYQICKKYHVSLDWLCGRTK